MTEDDAYLAMIAVRRAKKVKNTRSGASNLSLCMSYVVKRDTRAYSRLPLPLLEGLMTKNIVQELYFVDYKQILKRMYLNSN